MIKTLINRILCKLNRHNYVMDNRGIKKSFNVFIINYYECEYCNKWKLTFGNPVPDSYLKEALRQKQKFIKNLEKRIVLFEKAIDPIDLELLPLLRELAEEHENDL